MENKLQMTLGDIDKIYEESNGLNLPLLKEATRQVELKVVDEHNRKERIDTRAYTLLTILLGLLSLIFGAIASGYLQYPSVLGFAGVILVGSIMYLFQALKPRAYAESGTYPKAWLSTDYLRGHESEEQNNHILAFALAHRLNAQESNIRIGDASNSQRLELLNRALTVSQCSLFPIILSMILEIF